MACEDCLRSLPYMFTFMKLKLLFPFLSPLMYERA